MVPASLVGGALVAAVCALVLLSFVAGAFVAVGGAFFAIALSGAGELVAVPLGAGAFVAGAFWSVAATAFVVADEDFAFDVLAASGVTP